MTPLRAAAISSGVAVPDSISGDASAAGGDSVAIIWVKLGETM